MTARSDSNRDAALAALKRGDAAEAIRRLTDAVREAPDDAELVGFLGVAYGMEGDLDAAVFWLRKATQLGPGSAPAYYNLGGALERAGQAEEAIRAYRRALVLEPQHPRSRAALARLEAESAGAEAVPSPSPFPPAATAMPGGTAVVPEPVEVPAPEPNAETEPAAEGVSPGPWTCRCGSANAAGYLYCPRCGGAAPAPPAPEEAVEADTGEDRDEGELAVPSPPPASGMSRNTRIALGFAALPMLILLGFGIGLLIRGRQGGPPPNVPALNAPPSQPSIDIPVAPAPQPPAITPAPAIPTGEPGLGISREAAQAFLQRDVEWDFQEHQDEDGVPRLYGRSADNLTEAELAGDPANLSEVYLHFVVSPDEAWSADLPNGRRVVALFDEYAPGGSRWAMQKLEELIVSGTDGEREERFGDRYGRLRWVASSGRARVGLSARPAGLVVVPVPSSEQNWLEEPRQIPVNRRYRFAPRNGGDAIVGTLLKFQNDIYTVRLDSGEVVELHGEDGFDIEPVEPTEREREWLQKAESVRRSRRQEAIRRGDAQGRPLEVGRRYRFQVAGDDVTGTLESLEEDLYHVRSDDRGETVVLRPEGVLAVEAL